MNLSSYALRLQQPTSLASRIRARCSSSSRRAISPFPPASKQPAGPSSSRMHAIGRRHVPFTGKWGMPSTQGWSKERRRDEIVRILDFLSSEFSLSKRDAQLILANRTGINLNTVQGWASEGTTRDPPTWQTLDLLRYELGLAPVRNLAAEIRQRSAAPLRQVAQPAKTLKPSTQPRSAARLRKVTSLAARSAHR